MTDERDESSGGESVARTTARDVPFARAAESVEAAPAGRRPAQLPRDPTYEAELAQVELAVLRDPEPREDPSTKQGGRRGYAAAGYAPESVTPESPGAREQHGSAPSKSPEPPSSGGRSVASGTLLSVGAVDPRGKTERHLETPRMFFSQADAGVGAYFKPGKIPAVTVHQTLETETVKLSDSIDPRRAKTLPRIDRAALARGAAPQAPESTGGAAVSQPQVAGEEARPDDSSPPDSAERDPQPASLQSEPFGQIHASLSPFREQTEQPEPSYGWNAAPTRPEPLAGRRASEGPRTPPLPLHDASAIPTQRDLPAHRAEASPLPEPARPAAEPEARRAVTMPAEPRDASPSSEGARPTTASIAAEEPERRSAWVNYVAFAAALLLALMIGLLLTRERAPRQTTPDAPRATPAIPTTAPPPSVKVEPLPAEVVSIAETPPGVLSAQPAPAPRPLEPRALSASKKGAPELAAPGAAAASATPPHRPAPAKTHRETIF